MEPSISSWQFSLYGRQWCKTCPARWPVAFRNFSSFLYDELVDHILLECDKYAAWVCDGRMKKGQMNGKSRFVMEKYAFLRLLQKFGKNHPFIDIILPIRRFLLIFMIFFLSWDRFALLLKDLHFTVSEDNSDPTYKFKEVLDKIIQRFKLYSKYKLWRVSLALER